MEIIIFINVYQWVPAARVKFLNNLAQFYNEVCNLNTNVQCRKIFYTFSYFLVYLIQNNVMLILQFSFHIVNTLESQ